MFKILQEVVPAIYLHKGREDKPTQRSLCWGPIDTHHSVCAPCLRSSLRSNSNSYPTPKVWEAVIHFQCVTWDWWRELHTGIFGEIILQHEFRPFKLSQGHANLIISFLHDQTACMILKWYCLGGSVKAILRNTKSNLKSSLWLWWSTQCKHM